MAPGTLTLSRVGVGLHPVDEEDLTVQDRVKKDGTFEIKEVQDSNYAVYVWGLEENWYVKSARFGADDVLSEGLQLEKGAANGKLEVTLSSARGFSQRRRRPCHRCEGSHRCRP